MSIIKDGNVVAISKRRWSHPEVYRPFSIEFSQLNIQLTSQLLIFESKMAIMNAYLERFG
jgi:hypothetical protein